MIKKMMDQVKTLHRDESGQGMAEYGLIIALVAVICIVAFQLLGRSIGEKVQEVGDTIGE